MSIGGNVPWYQKLPFWEAQLATSITQILTIEIADRRGYWCVLGQTRAYDSSIRTCLAAQNPAKCRMYRFSRESVIYPLYRINEGSIAHRSRVLYRAHRSRSPAARPTRTTRAPLARGARGARGSRPRCTGAHKTEAACRCGAAPDDADGSVWSRPM